MSFIRPHFKKTYLLALTVVLTVFAISCGKKKGNETMITPPTAILVTKESFGKMDDKEVTLYTMRNRNGMEMRVMNYGGIILSISTPDKNGVFEDVTLGYDSLKDYMKASPYFGALIGRYGNRIAKGRFTLDGTPFHLKQNNGTNHLHGGVKGFDKVYWNIEDVSDSLTAKLKLTYQSKDGEEGYPGNLNVEVIYSLTNENEIKIEYKATTDKKTVVNLTQHAYFNLSGNVKRDIMGHQLTIKASRFLPVDATLIPTGILQPVNGTPFDFQKPQLIGSRIGEKDVQLINGKGYDHCWVLDKKDGLEKIATLYDSVSGRNMEVFTDQPAIQFYSGNFLNGSNVGKGGVVYNQHAGLCLETQHFPDSPNKPSFPSTVLNPRETYQTTTVYKFSVVK
jgi:aldose 1-epimerase